VIVVVTIGLASCSPEGDVTGSTNKCASDSFPSYNPKVLEQCVAACIKCEHGTTITCTFQIARRRASGAAASNRKSLKRNRRRRRRSHTSRVNPSPPPLRARGVDSHRSARSYGVARQRDGSRPNSLGWLRRAFSPAFRAGSLYPLAPGCRRSWRGEV